MNLNADLGVLALLCAAAFGFVAPPLVRTVRPSSATWLLTAGAVASAISSTSVLAMLSLPALGSDDALMDALGLSPRVLDKDTGTGFVFGLLCLLGLFLLVVRFVRAFLRHRRAFRAASCFAVECGATAEQLLVLARDNVDVFALGGRPPVIVATRGALRALDPLERRSVLAHEQAHLRYRHHRHLNAVALSVALNPLLRPVPAAAALAVERWADEVAAGRTSRSVTSAALDRLARLYDGHASASPAVLAVAAASVSIRLAALRAAPAPLAPLRLMLAAGFALAALTAAAVVTGHTLDVLSLAAAATGHVLPHHR